MELVKSKVRPVQLKPLRMSSAELCKHFMSGRGPSPGTPSPLILRQEEENLHRVEREKVTASICSELQLWHKELKVIWQARLIKTTVFSPLVTSSPSRETQP